MSENEVLLAVFAGIAALFGLVSWLVKRMWTFMESTLTRALNDFGASLKSIDGNLRELTGQVRETRDDVAELTPVPQETTQPETPRARGEYGIHKGRRG